MALHETEDLIQTRRGEDGKPDTCTYHHARINLQQKIVVSSQSPEKLIKGPKNAGLICKEIYGPPPPKKNGKAKKSLWAIKTLAIHLTQAK